jgi:leader peptidase (prepilin peptidase)/N-methyltransferase
MPARSVGMEALPVWFVATFGAVLGAVLGSFCGVVIERVSVGQGTDGRSHCVCGRQLRASENVPVLSWLLLRGRAKCCGASIPGWYVALELGSAAFVAAAGAVAGLLGVAVAAVLLVAAAYGVAAVRRSKSV